jgi:hypothetical protein
MNRTEVKSALAALVAALALGLPGCGSKAEIPPGDPVQPTHTTEQIKQQTVSDAQRYMSPQEQQKMQQYMNRRQQ